MLSFLGLYDLVVLIGGLLRCLFQTPVLDASPSVVPYMVTEAGLNP